MRGWEWIKIKQLRKERGLTKEQRTIWTPEEDELLK